MATPSKDTKSKSLRGGKREGAGRKRGTSQTLAKTVRLKAMQEGDLPHEILLKVARGECIKVKKLVITLNKTGPNKGKEKCREWREEDYYPSFNERIDAAKTAAPYYAPKLAPREAPPGVPEDGANVPVQTVRLPDNGRG